MNKSRKMTAMAFAVTGALLATGFVSSADAQSHNSRKHKSQTYRITVKNLTYNQIFSPPVAVAHRNSVRVFAAGETARDGLEVLAEDGVPTDLASEMEAEGANVAIHGGASPAPVLPGQSVSFRLTASKRNSLVSVVGMLVTTNDAFFGLGAAHLKGAKKPYRVVAYDAGTEVNDEDCNHIPGPPCGNGGQTVTPGENGPDENGAVHVHRGIHQLSDGVEAIDASRDDWRNPVAEITITRVYRNK